MTCAESPILEIGADAFDHRVLHSKLPVLVLFCANDAPADQRLLALVGRWAPSASEALGIVRLLGEDVRRIAARWGMLSLPSVAVFNDSAICYQFSGEVSRLELNEILARIRHRNRNSLA